MLAKRAARADLVAAAPNLLATVLGLDMPTLRSQEQSGPCARRSEQLGPQAKKEQSVMLTCETKEPAARHDVTKNQLQSLYARRGQPLCSLVRKTHQQGQSVRRCHLLGSFAGRSQRPDTRNSEPTTRLTCEKESKLDSVKAGLTCGKELESNGFPSTCRLVSQVSLGH